MSQIRLLGEHPLAQDADGKLKSRIATAFPCDHTIISLPGIHATQRLAYLEIVSQQRARDGHPPLTAAEQSELWNKAVDLILEDSAVLIRPDPENMALAFQADELLQQLVPKHCVRFLYVLNAKVREAIKRRGECWRFSPLPRSPEEMKRMIAASRIGISGREIYYHNGVTGTRFLTYQDFASLGTLDDAELRWYLNEIKEYAAKTNPRGHPEVAFFLADESFSLADFAPCDFTLHGGSLQAVYVELERKFRNAVHPALRRTDPDNVEWRNHMCAALIGEPDDTVTEETLLGLSPEFFMQIEWLPGARIEEGELILDSIFEETAGDDPVLGRLCDEKSQKLIFNFVREYGDLEYVNIGRVIGSLSHRRPLSGRRDVYLAEVKLRDHAREIISIIRLQKWGIQEHLDDGKSLLDAIIQAEEYTEYTMDRRLGCRQLGMNLPSRVASRRISERYVGKQKHLQGIMIWSPYFERDYIHGIATDKIPAYRLENDTFALEFARLLGRAAAPNMIVGRCDADGSVLFDDGDEILVENEDRLPLDIIVADMTGTFADYRRELQSVAADYAEPIARRLTYVAHPDCFTEVYLEALVDRFVAIQQEYQRRKRAFDCLFKHCRRDEAGSFAYRWEQVLERLHRTDARELAELIRRHILARCPCATP